MINTTMHSIGGFLFMYPLFMSLVWIISSLLFYARRERSPLEADNNLEELPFVSILLPSYNEGAHIEETVRNLDTLYYQHYEIIVINDGSTDTTREILARLSRSIDRLKVINIRENKGKANALYYGTIASKGEIVVTMDSDALLDKDALRYMVPHFTTPGKSERVGAVTGNPRVRNRRTLLGKIQVVEYSSIIGLIKRSQRILGKMMTVSGVFAAFRKQALLDVGFWDKDLITDDIGITWKLQERFWDVRYEPRALCWMLVPETVKGLLQQRIRWAQGGIEVLLRHRAIFKDYRQRRLYPVYIEQTLSILWSISWMFYLMYLVFFDFSPSMLLYGAYIAFISLIQLTVAIFIDRQYEDNLVKYIWWAGWYPMVYWMISVLALIPAIPKAVKILTTNKTEYATWDSPDRGKEV
ncbi:poly-beta-1,6 N-acetyl-D-glucosamine synthase [Rossellomorea aquimaris]|uniref:poly-beta-1,6-N-acetyl-D-glucosamine synthase n=1 Tax=Rossellomorea aquimaris TaxID=189382 RepID=UPI001CD7D232|nr:poly-beta-1,6-N-acetyl-D-glucosamine synthase [Rossellomorea aquimaris]MCA1060844.1 poly-beta-1,6 N-acetyl-D-glucosamine synthase [Rossellomorea aquimaris]